MKRFLNEKKEQFLQWVTDRRVKKQLTDEWIPQVKKRLSQSSRIVFLVLTPEHGNLGDHAIAYAETQMLTELGIEYIEVTEKRLWQLEKNTMLSVMNGHPILINGGGNLGTLWIGVEYIQRAIMRYNPDSPIAILPNTIFYEESAWGQEEYRRSVLLYNSLKELHLYARERHSYEVMKNAYKNVKLMPDMVLSLNQCREGSKRKGCLLCLRDDCEKTRTAEEDDALLEQVRVLFGDDYQNSDMRLESNVSIEDREYELEQKWDTFRHAELVITDRLHGMIFCAVTGTPCVVIDSKSPKVKGCFEWVKSLGYIAFANDVSCVTDCYLSVKDAAGQYDNTNMKAYFDELKNDIVKMVKEE